MRYLTKFVQIKCPIADDYEFTREKTVLFNKTVNNTLKLLNGILEDLAPFFHFVIDEEKIEDGR